MTELIWGGGGGGGGGGWGGGGGRGGGGVRKRGMGNVTESGGNSELKSEYFRLEIQSDYWLQLFLRSHAFISSIIPVKFSLI